MRFTNVDWEAEPHSRGFWLDEEMMEATKSRSRMTARLLQRKKLIASSRCQRPTGAWSRAWTPFDLMLIAATNELAHDAGISNAAAVEIFSVIPKAVLADHLAPNLSWDVPQGYERTNIRLPETQRDRSFDRRDDLVLLLANRNVVYFINYAESRKEPQGVGVAIIEDIDVKTPRIVKRRAAKTSVEKLVIRANTIFQAHLSRLGMCAFDAIAGTSCRIVFHRAE